jgi:hypothetical protein
MKKFNFLLCAVFLATQIFAQTVATFENLPLAADTFWNGSDLSGGFNSGLGGFSNDYNANFSSWSGFSYSNKTDNTTAGYLNQYSAITGAGFNSTNYVIGNGYGNTRIRLNGTAAKKPVKGFYVTNTTYAYLSLKNGDQFAKKFGGATGTDPDWFRLTVKGWNNGVVKNEKVEVYLADYRAADSTKDYILKDWHWVDLQTLGNVDSVFFQLESTDTAGGFGMNTPAYFALDNFTTLEQVPFQTIAGFEDLTLEADTFWTGSDLSGGFASGNGYFKNNYNTNFSSWSGFVYSSKTDTTTAGYGNQYSAITGVGYNNSPNYVVANEYGNAKINLTGAAGGGKLVKGFYVTNTTYAYTAMRDGDMFAKKFGGTNGADPDWFRLTVKGYSGGAMKSESVEFYLADFRNADNTQDYIVRDWQWVNLQALGNVDSLQFFLESTDTAGGFGMNNPAYFAIDNFITADTAYAQPAANDDAVTTNYLTAQTIAVLANDVNLIANPYTVELLSSPKIAGAIAQVVFNEVVYTPAVGLVSKDTLVYRVVDNLGFADTAVVLINVTGITAIESLEASLQFSAYPNPFGNALTVYCPQQNDQPLNVSVYNLVGQLVLNEKVNVSQFTLQTETLQPGVYMLRLACGNNVSSKKLIKE